MNELVKHIECLLLNHDCVILPEMGGFVVFRENAQIDAENQSFQPPTRTLGFNPQLVMNDGLLVQSIMQTYDTNFPNAQRILDQKIEMVQNQLQEKGKWEIGDLGTLHKNAEGHLQFEAKDASTFMSPDLFGFAPIDMQNWNIIVPQVEESVSAELTESIHDEESAPVPLLEEDQEEEETSSHKYLWWKSAAIFVGLLLTFWLTSVPVKNGAFLQKGDFSQANSALYMFPVSSILNKTQSATVVPKKVAGLEKVDSVAPELPQDVVASAEEEIAVTDTSPDYYTLVLASQVKLSNAEDLIKRLKNKGFENGSILETSSMRRVVYASYSSETEAYNAKIRLLSQCSDFEEAWVLHVH